MVVHSVIDAFKVASFPTEERVLNTCALNSAKFWWKMMSCIQRSAKRIVRGCEKFVPALAYLFCPALPGSCLARFTNLLADLCTV